MKTKKEDKQPLDLLIEKVKADQTRVAEINTQFDALKQEKKDIGDRLKGVSKDLAVLGKYANSEQKKLIESLHLDVSNGQRGRNAVSEIALSILAEKKSMTNEALYNAYIDRIPKGQEPETYTYFNIRLRSLFNSGTLTRTKGKDTTSSRDDIITYTVSDN